MDPTTNPTPTPNPTPNPAPTPEPAPTPAPTLDQPVAPNPTPVNPVINPANPTPVNPVFQPTGGGLAATEPVTQPEPAPAPDPVEEELKAPMKAADPVPGSIGSAVSGPDGMGGSEMASGPTENPFAKATDRTPSVSFNDPATQPDASAMPQNTMAASGGKKNNKMTMIILAAVAGLIVIILAVILIMQLGGGGEPTAVNPSGSEPGNVNATLGCSRSMTEEELESFGDVSSGTIEVSADFENNTLTTIKKINWVIPLYSEEIEAPEFNEPKRVLESSATLANLSDPKSFFLPTDDEGNVTISFSDVKDNYEKLDFTCEVL